MKRFLLGSVLALLFSLLSCNDNSSSGPDKKEDGGIEVPCNAENEGEVVSPVDSDREYVCKNSSWNVVDSSRHCEDCKGEAISTSSSSSSNNNVILSAESSSSVVAGETKQSSSEQSTESSNSEVGDSSSSVETTEDESSSSEDAGESSSSEEIAMFLCDDGVTYVLDLANCEVESSSSEEIGESSSSEATTPSSSENVEESSSSEDSLESSSSEIIAVSSSSLNSIYDATNNTLTDLRDGQVYKTVTIGTQVWMAQNLNYLPEDTIGTIWSGLSLCGGGTWKSKMEGDCSIFGRLYETDFTNEKKDSICPNGWSLPTGNQFQKMMSYLGENSANKMKINNDKYWQSGNATNESGFSAIPSGVYSRAKGFNNLFSENEEVAAFAHVQYLGGANGIEIVDSDGIISNQSFGNGIFLAVRCIRN
ncbi:FISUMP domain-containing protein [Fibrobacter sp.]|uniref:FISUMP domain-containing protein n=1 Tax=Fibrobacter sp. TaxID=35828 RepID=UPI00388EB4C7